MRLKFTASLALVPFLAAAAPEAGPVILVLGPPGSGKTVNAKRIGQRWDVPVIGMADLLKGASGWGKAGSQKVLRTPIESGDLVGDEMSINLLGQRLGREDARRGFVLDGFPLTVGQAEYLEDLCNQRGFRAPVVVHLTVSDDIATERLRRRGREDDKPAIIQRRMADYHAQADLVLKRYREVATVDASGSQDEVWRGVEQGLAGLIGAPRRR